VLERLKAKGYVKFWDSFSLSSDYSSVSASALKTRTNIDPLKLRLDEVGYDYRMVLVAAVAIGTTFGLTSSQIEGQLGFLLGYASALIPILVVGVGSVAPSLIGEVLLTIKSNIDEKSKEQLLSINAGKFLVGYCLGLPLVRFDQNSLVNMVEFYQVRPRGKSEKEERSYFGKKNYSQDEIARCSVACLGGPVAECLDLGEASGNAARDVNKLQDLVLAVEPALNPDAVQNHIRWSAFTAHSIIKNRYEEYKKLKEAFKQKKSLEECISIIEGI